MEVKILNLQNFWTVAISIHRNSTRSIEFPRQNKNLRKFGRLILCVGSILALELTDSEFCGGSNPLYKISGL